MSTPVSSSRSGVSYVAIETMSPWPPAKNANSSHVDVVTSRTFHFSSYSGMIPWSFIQSITGSGENANRTMDRSSPPSDPSPESSPHATAMRASALSNAIDLSQPLFCILSPLIGWSPARRILAT